MEQPDPFGPDSKLEPDEIEVEAKARRIHGHHVDIVRIIGSTLPLRRYKDQVKLLLSLLKDWATGAYRNVPTRVIISTTITLTYVFSLIDAVPDTLPVVGYFDDAALLGLLLLQIEDELERYKVWSQHRARSTTPQT